MRRNGWSWSKGQELVCTIAFGWYETREARKQFTKGLVCQLLIMPSFRMGSMEEAGERLDREMSHCSQGRTSPAWGTCTPLETGGRHYFEFT